MRVFPPGADDHWISVDSASIPSDIVPLSDRVAHALETATGVKEMHLAVDWVYASTAHSPIPRWLPMEVNANPAPTRYTHMKNPRLSEEQAGLLADQLARVAVSGSTS